MTTHEKIIEFYRSLLNSVGITEDENGILQYRFLSIATPKPVMILDKNAEPKVDRPLAMPTKEILSRMSEEGLIGFNPLCESTIRGESEVFRRLKDHVTTRIGITLWQLVKLVINLSLKPDEVAKLNSNQMELLSRALGSEQPNEKFLTKFEKVWLGSLKSDTKIVTIYIKRDAKQVGVPEPYTRAAIVNFPLARELEKAPTTLCGQTVAKYEVRLLSNILNAVLPGITEDDQYSYFGNPINVPNLTALLNAWYLIACKMNEFSKAFEDYLLDPQDIIDVKWFSDMQQLPRWNGVIPTLEGNVGDGEDITERVERGRKAAQTLAPPPARNEPVRRNEEVEREEVKNGGLRGRSDDRPRVSRDEGRDLANSLRDLSREENLRTERQTQQRRHRPYGVRDRFESDDRPRGRRFDDRPRSRYDDDYDDRPRRGHRDRDRDVILKGRL